jgi:hypothetical protein
MWFTINTHASRAVEGRLAQRDAFCMARAALAPDPEPRALRESAVALAADRR